MKPTIHLEKIDDMWWPVSGKDSILLGHVADNSIALNADGLDKAKVVIEALGWEVVVK